jgi:hypothetical protein
MTRNPYERCVRLNPFVQEVVGLSMGLLVLVDISRFRFCLASLHADGRRRMVALQRNSGVLHAGECACVCAVCAFCYVCLLGVRIGWAYWLCVLVCAYWVYLCVRIGCACVCCVCVCVLPSVGFRLTWTRSHINNGFRSSFLNSLQSLFTKPYLYCVSSKFVVNGRGTDVFMSAKLPTGFTSEKVAYTL